MKKQTSWNIIPIISFILAITVLLVIVSYKAISRQKIFMDRVESHNDSLSNELTDNQLRILTISEISYREGYLNGTLNILRNETYDRTEFYDTKFKDSINFRNKIITNLLKYEKSK